jgi:hypothetical protein
MSNRTAGGLDTTLRCSKCGGKLWELSHKWRIPKQSDDKAWRELIALVQVAQPLRRAHTQKRGKELLGQIDWQIEVISNRKPSQAKEAGLKKLRRERADVVAKYFSGSLSKVE